nr:CotH kinase family protein [Parablautia muri]
MEYIDENKENEEAGEVVLFDEKGIKLYAGEAESIGGRGNSTWGLSKKPYQFKLCEKVDFFGFGESRSWNLIANGYDETRLRNEIAMELAKALGMDYVPEGQMIDLYVNDIYYGNYYLTEKIRVGSEMVDIRDMETVLDSIYSPEELERLERLETEDGDRKWVENGYDETDFSGGYLLERELPSRFEETISGFITNQGDCYALQSPAYASKEQVDYIADLMQEFQDAAAESSGMHPVTGKHYSEYIDVTSFVQKYLVEEISKNYDGGVTSSFFYKPQTAVSNKIFAGPVWDYDVAFGNCNLDEIASNPAGITKMNDHIYGTNLFALLYEKEDFYKGIQTLYEEKALPFLEKLLDTGIDEMVKESRASAEMDSIRWEELENRYQYYEEYDNSVRYLKWFISKRMDFLNEVWLEGVVYHNVSFMVDDEAWQIACVKDGETVENEPIPSRYSSVFMGWTTKAGVPFDRFKPVYEDMVFYARWQELDVEDVVLK